MPASASPKFGRIYRKYNKAPNGEKLYHDTWTIRVRGKDYATHTTDYKDAERQLIRLVARLEDETKKAAKGEAGVTVADLLDLVLSDYVRKGNRSIASQRIIVRHVKDAMGQVRAIDVDEDRLNEYRDKRLAAGFKPASVNHEMRALRRGFKLGLRANRITRMPYFEMLRENNVRKGFLAFDKYETAYSAMPYYLKPLLCVAYHLGMRKEELLSLRIDQVDLRSREITLDPGTTKNLHGRTAPLYGPLVGVLSNWIVQTRREYPECIWLFHKRGKRLGDFRKSWQTAMTSVGLGNIRGTHDLRRSAVRNLSRAGVPRAIAMQITGHLTESVYRRYDIVDASDTRLAERLMDDYLSRAS